MKKILYLFLLVTGTSFAQIIPFPEVNLKNKLIQLSPDTNSDCVSLPEEVSVDNNLKVTTNNEIKTIELMDTSGKTIIIKNDNTLDMSGYNNGYYFIKVSTNKETKK